MPRSRSSMQPSRDGKPPSSFVEEETEAHRDGAESLQITQRRCRPGGGAIRRNLQQLQPRQGRWHGTHPHRRPSGCSHGAERAQSSCFRKDWRGDSCGGSGDSTLPSLTDPRGQVFHLGNLPRSLHLEGSDKTQMKWADGDRGTGDRACPMPSKKAGPG